MYAAFDIMNREGDWTHRTNGYLTDVSIEASRRTRLDGSANMLGINTRDLSLDKATLLPADRGAGAGVP